MTDINKIAAEAAVSICDKFGMTYPAVGFLGAQHWDDVTAIIKSAIEKVDEMWRDRFRKFEKIEERFGPAKQRATATEEREMNNLDKIAADAARGWFSETELGKVRANILTHDLTLVIKAAIEKAYQQGRNDEFDDEFAP